MEAVLSLGSNLGNRLQWLVAARAALTELPGVGLAAAAPVYASEPVDVGPAHAGLWFYNTVLVLETGLPPFELSRGVHAIEDALGRRRQADRNAPRTIDIDLICYGEVTLDTPELRLPHPKALQRRFVCQPLGDVRPLLRLPGCRETVREILASLPPRPAVIRAPEQWPA